MDPLSPRPEELEKVLRQAHLHKMRQEKARALEMITRATEMAPEDPDTWELLGDMLADLGRFDEAQAAYKRCLELAPDRVSVEKKHARAVFYQSEKSYERARMEQIMAGEVSAEVSLVPRKPGLALMMGIVLPSSAQFYNGQFVKGGIILAVLVVLSAVLLLNPGFVAAASGFVHLIAARPEREATEALSFPILFTAFLWLILYIYSIIDGIVVSARLASSYRPPSSPAPLANGGPKS
ncbi:MAG: tetratricopeptide repeat protein [Fimbriimonadia bacterium]|jgi:tetratricopeptide (TPR) repeat protein